MSSLAEVDPAIVPATTWGERFVAFRERGGRQRSGVSLQSFSYAWIIIKPFLFYINRFGCHRDSAPGFLQFQFCLRCRVWFDLSFFMVPVDALVSDPDDALISDPVDALVSDPDDALVSDPDDALVSDPHPVSGSDLNPTLDTDCVIALQCPMYEQSLEDHYSSI
ncbi:hypothetical protein EVAR_33048_1 [Eumeta japonica]|uniref:Uncharacterized protein n=1 Tax=Eumeta variegata TaxID=151549 RepID=A0A4C1WWN3_EUMVA|nr:hypothetical protein EVAR_33048_1 [Eumeta japonica]